MASFARELRDSVSTDWRVQGPYQWATVAVLHIGGSFGTLDVYLDSTASSPGATLALGIPFLNGYAPTVGDTVLVGRMAGAARTQRVILGPLEQVGSGLNAAGEAFFADMTLSGLTGTSAVGYRHVGATDFGPPLTGTFQTHDVLYDLTTFGRWVCTAGGSPGTWVGLEGAVTSPKAPTIVVNTTGATSWWYKVVAEGKNGSTFYDAIPSAAVKITNGAATPNNTVNWTAPIGVDASKIPYVVLRSTDGITYSRIAFPGAGVLTFTDNNASAVAYTVATFNPGGGFVLGGLRARCSAKQSANIADTGGADIILPLDTIVYDFTNQLPSGASYYSTANKQLTAPISGLYQINAEATIPNNTSGDRSMTIFVNGVLARSLAQQTSSVAGGNPRLSGSATLYLNAGDVVEIRVAAPGATAGVISGGIADYIYLGS